MPHNPRYLITVYMMKNNFSYLTAKLILTAMAMIFAMPGNVFSQSSASKRQYMQEQAIFNASLEDGTAVTYEQVLKDPDNIKLNLAYARTQIRNGDIKGAAATTERILRLRPNLHEVRLFYAAILYRLDTISEAKVQLAKLENVNLKENTKKEKKALEKMIARREKITSWTAQLAAGMAYDTNRNAFPEDDTIVYPNGAELKMEGKASKDFSYMALAGAEVTHKTGKQKKDSLFAGFSYYMSKQSDLSFLDMGILSGKAGININRLRYSLLPQLVYNTVNIDGNSYMDTAGLSLKGTCSITNSNKTLLYAEGKYLDQKYKNSSRYKNNDQRNGYAATGTLGIRHLITPRMTLETEGIATIKDTKDDAYDTQTAGLGLKHFWLFGKNKYLMTSFTATQETYSKAGEDNLTNQFLQAVGKKRKDTVTRGSVTFGFPLKKNISMSTGYEYYHNDSNIQVYTYTNHKITAMINCKFSL